MGLMAGNCIVLKVASDTVLVGCEIEKIVIHAGLPDGVFRHLVCSGAEASKLMFENKIDMVRVHAESINIKLENQKASLSPIPWHPGALKYYAEKGIKIDDQGGKK